MAKNANPADAHRKALRKKELKKNKVERQKKRDFALVKKDTSELDDEIAELEAITALSPVQKARLSELKSELESIIKKKEEYVEEHPEQRGLVYAAARRRQKEKEAAERPSDAQPAKKQRSKFDKNGLPRHPERSVYYDPIMNPYGVPPPGMPYAERPLLPGEVDSDAEAESAKDDEDDTPLPSGPRPMNVRHILGDEVTSDDDIPMPTNTRPGDISVEELNPPLPPGPSPMTQIGIPAPPLPNMLPFAQAVMSPLPLLPPGSTTLPPITYPRLPNFPPPPPPGMGMLPPIPPFPPIGMSGPFIPPPPSGFPPTPGMMYPPPPPGFAFDHGVPAPPPGFFPRKRGSQSTSSIQDPLSSVPHETYQAHRDNRAQPGQPSTLPVNAYLPPKPVAASSSSSTNVSKEAVAAAATVFAGPELRDFKKESTVFVPSALKRKRGAVGSSSSGGHINAAPNVGSGDADTGPSAPRPDLMDALKQKFGPMAVATTNPSESVVAKKRKLDKPLDDYEKFKEEMGDLLVGPPS